MYTLNANLCHLYKQKLLRFARELGNRTTYLDLLRKKEKSRKNKKENAFILN